MDNKQELIDIIETVYRGASKGRGLVVSPKGLPYRICLQRVLLTRARRLFDPLPLLILNASCFDLFIGFCTDNTPRTAMTSLIITFRHTLSIQNETSASVQRAFASRRSRTHDLHCQLGSCVGARCHVFDLAHRQHTLDDLCIGAGSARMSIAA